ncbi:MAG: hypothetical protein EOP56_15725 [Sphingobacteriales bacterium]|nr:MAG: hypothetical protein EOP56_15725 [Sphingobacteriales bacterium]
MKKKALFFATFLSAVVFLNSCTVRQRSMSDANTRLNLTTKDMTISEPYGGTAEQTKILGIDWSRLFGYKAGYKTSGSYAMMGWGGQLTPVENFAVHDMMERHPNFDAVIYPSFKKKQFTFLFFYQKTTVDVSARLGKLNTTGGSDSGSED